MRRVVFAIVLLGALELASFGTVLAIASVRPQTAAVSTSNCIPYWMVYDRSLCPPH